MLREGLIPTPSSTIPTQPSWYDHCGFVDFFFGSQGPGIRFRHRKPWGLIFWTPFFWGTFSLGIIFSKRGGSAVVEGDTVDGRNPAPPGM